MLPILTKGDNMTTFQTSQTKMHSKNELFEFQNWDVYRKAIQMVSRCRDLAQTNKPIGIHNFGDQLTRAALSIPLNIAEGISRFGSKEKLNYLRIAKGSLFECVACIDVLAQIKAIDIKQYQSLNQELSLIGRMLSGLIRSVKERNS